GADAVPHGEGSGGSLLPEPADFDRRHGRAGHGSPRPRGFLARRAIDGRRLPALQGTLLTAAGGLAYRRILVTGVSGILGATLRQTLGQYPGVEWTFSSRADCDLRDPRACIAYVSRVRPDAILQLAAVSGGIGLSMRQPATMLRDNVLINLSVLEAARQLGIGKLVLALSSGMYPAEAPQPIAETSIHDGPAHDTNYGYAYAKRLLAPAVRAYREEFGLNVIGLVPNALYGPFDRFDQESGTVIRALIRRFHEARDCSVPVVV